MLLILSTRKESTDDRCGYPFHLGKRGNKFQILVKSGQQALGSFGPIFIAVSMSLFAFTTLIGNYYYCEGCLKYILRRDPSRGGMLVFRLAVTALVFVGAIVSAGLAWDTADMLQGTMVIINIPVILILGNKGVAVLKDYMRQRKEGKTPEFHAADIGITGTDYWN